MAVTREKKEQGFSLVEMIVVVAIIGILAAIGIPAYFDALGRARQRRTMSDMNAIAQANAMATVDNSSYVVALANLAPAYMNPAPVADAWGNPWVYTPAANQRAYELRSTGKDGALGPAAPDPWFNEPYEPDLVMDTGQFTQSPVNQ